MDRIKRLTFVLLLITTVSIGIFTTSVFLPQSVVTTTSLTTSTHHIFPSEYSVTSNQIVILHNGQKCLLGMVRNKFRDMSIYLVRASSNDKVLWSRKYTPRISNLPIGVVEGPNSGCIIASESQDSINTRTYWLSSVDANGNSVWNNTIDATSIVSINHIFPIDQGLILPSIITSSNGSSIHLQEMNYSGNMGWEKNISISDSTLSLSGGMLIDNGSVAFLLTSVSSSVQIVTVNAQGNLISSKRYFLVAGRIDFADFTWYDGNYYILLSLLTPRISNNYYIAKLSPTEILWNQNITDIHPSDRAKIAVNSKNIFVAGIHILDNLKNITNINIFDNQAVLLDHYNTTHTYLRQINKILFDNSGQLLIFGCGKDRSVSLQQFEVVRLLSLAQNYIQIVQYSSAISSGLLLMVSVLVFVRHESKKLPESSSDDDLLYSKNEVKEKDMQLKP